MEESTKQTTQAENLGAETEAQGQEPKEGRLFTQEEVNSFIQSRISRMKAQIAKEAKAEYEQKLGDLNAREMKILVKEKLSERGMPKKLADVITCADEQELNAKLDALQEIYGKNDKKEENPVGFVQIGNGDRGTGYKNGSDPIRTAMGLERKR